MSGQGDNRSIGLGARPDRADIGGNGNQSIHIGGSVDGAAIMAGHGNMATVTVTRVQPPPAHQVDVAAEIAGLRALMEGLNTPERGTIGWVMRDAGEEAAKPQPDKQKVAYALESAVKASKGAVDFVDNADKIGERVVHIAGWLGPFAKGALALLGLTM